MTKTTDFSRDVFDLPIRKIKRPRGTSSQSLRRHRARRDDVVPRVAVVRAVQTAVAMRRSGRLRATAGACPRGAVFLTRSDPGNLPFRPQHAASGGVLRAESVFLAGESWR